VNWSHFFWRVFKSLWWRECQQSLVNKPLSSLFQIHREFLQPFERHFSRESVLQLFSNVRCDRVKRTSPKMVVAFSSGFHVCWVTEQKWMAPLLWHFGARPQWRCLTSVAPDATSCGALRTFWLLWILWVCFACSEWKNSVSSHFQKSGRFFRSNAFGCNFVTGRRWTGTVSPQILFLPGPMVVVAGDRSERESVMPSLPFGWLPHIQNLLSRPHKSIVTPPAATHRFLRLQ